jgi:hypothetical protein
MTHKIFVCALICAASLGFGQTKKVNSASEDTFLATAGPGWVAIDDGVYELRRDNGSVERQGFGKSSLGYLLEQLMTWQEQVQAMERDDNHFWIQQAMADLESDINAVIEVMESPAADAPCSGPSVYLSAGAECGVSAYANASFIDFGPCNWAQATTSAQTACGTDTDTNNNLYCYTGLSSCKGCGLDSGIYFASAWINFTTCELTSWKTAGDVCGGIPE